MAGCKRAATSSALLTIKPSISKTMRRSAAFSMAPAIMAISKPPKVASTSSGSMAAACLATAASITRCLCRMPSADKPVPAPTHCATGVPVSLCISAAAAVVLPMPISPKPSTLPGSVSTRSMPACMADAHSCAVIAGFLREVAGARALLAVEQAVARAEVVLHARIDYIEGAVVLACKHIDGGAIGQEVLHHLPGHVLRIGGNAFGDHAMVGGEHDNGGLVIAGCVLCWIRPIWRARVSRCPRLPSGLVL